MAKFFFTPQLIALHISIFLSSCQWSNDTPQPPSENIVHEQGAKLIQAEYEDDRYDKMLLELGLTDIRKIDSSIAIDLKYASVDNFLGKNLYGDHESCFMQKEVAQGLSKAQQALKKIDKSMTLVIYDAARPRSIQEEMWDNVETNDKVKKRFLANPSNVSMHNLGLAVDVSILLKDSTPLDMGTEFDFMGELAYPCLQDYFAEQGLLGYNHINNREILKSVMEAGGFNANKYEWWHFSIYTKEQALQKFAIIEDFDSFTPPIATKSEQGGSLKFCVQIAASNSILHQSGLCIRSAKQYQHNGMYKYFSGEYGELSDAYRHRDSLLSAGCKSAFVIAFYNEKRIDVGQALQISDAN